MKRRCFLQRAVALGLAAVARSAASGPAAAGDFCSTAQGLSRRLFVPRDRGYLGRVEVRGKPLILVAARAAGLPRGTTHGVLAYRAHHDGRDYVNPTLVVRRGERVQVQFVNRLDEPTITHWHGLGVDTRNDGSGMSLIGPGQAYEYAFDVRDRGSLYWYHPHPHGTTGRQLYDGLFGMLAVEDEDDESLRKALDLIPGRTEIALVLQDRRADPSYSRSAADAMHGFLGDALYVNGSPCPYFDVASRVYRLRLLNACNARTLNLAFRTAAGSSIPFVLIGNDGGLLASPQRAEQAFLATAERLDLLIDLRDAAVGETVQLETLAFDPMHAEMPATATDNDHPSMGHTGEAAAAAHHHANAWPEGAARALMQLRVRERVAYDRQIPTSLSRIAPIDIADARERPFRLGFNKGRWRINDRVFAMGETPIEVTRDTTEVWLLRNYHTSMPHAMHLHGFHFEVLERETSPDFVHALAIDERGRVATDLGRKDTVLVWPGESARVAIRFTMPFQGPQTYMFHCHNVEHEDGGMMLGVKVT